MIIHGNTNAAITNTNYDYTQEYKCINYEYKLNYDYTEEHNILIQKDYNYSQTHKTIIQLLIIIIHRQIKSFILYLYTANKFIYDN